MTQTVTLSRIDAPQSPSLLGGSVSVAPVVYHLSDVPRPQPLDAARCEPPHEVAARVVVDPGTRASRRSRLRAAYADAASAGHAEGATSARTADTNVFVAALRAEIARSNLRSERPSLIGYVVRRCTFRHAPVAGGRQAATA